MPSIRILIVLAAAILPGQSPTDSVLAITATRLVDVVAGTVVPNGMVIVRSGQIESVGRRSSLTIPGGAVVHDLGDVTLLPGLIDAHVHLTLGGRPRANAEATLRAGFTTVQDLGALGYANLRLRDSIETGAWTGPRIIAAGPWLGVSDGICDFKGIGVRSPDERLARIQADVARGADVIKLCVTGWPATAFADPDSVELDSAGVSAVIAEGRRLGRPTVAHAIGRAGAAAAVRGGVAGLAHAAFVDDATIGLMREQRTWMASTLESFAHADSVMFLALVLRMQAALRGSVPIVLGTDAGVVPHGANAKEFATLVRLGMTPMDAIGAGTIGPARALGLADRLGSLEAGKLADLVAVVGDPVADIAVLEQVVFVVKDGRVIVKR